MPDGRVVQHFLDKSFYRHLPPWKLTCPLKRDQFKRKFHLPTIIFRGNMLVFKGVCLCLEGRGHWVGLDLFPWLVFQGYPSPTITWCSYQVFTYKNSDEFTFPETRKLRRSKINGWKTVLSFWVSAYFQRRTVSFREGKSFSPGVYWEFCLPVCTQNQQIKLKPPTSKILVHLQARNLT